MGAGLPPRAGFRIEDLDQVLARQMEKDFRAIEALGSKPQPRPLPKMRSVEDMPRQAREQGPSLRIASFLYLRRAL